MKLIVATTKTQATRKSDFCYVPEGEPLTFGTVCHSGRGAIDSGCGCQRSLVGIHCRKGTTTFEVVERPDLTEADFVQLLTTSIVNAWKVEPAAAAAHAASEAKELIRLAAVFPVGSVIEKRGRAIQVRQAA